MLIVGHIIISSRFIIIIILQENIKILSIYILKKKKETKINLFIFKSKTYC